MITYYFDIDIIPFNFLWKLITYFQPFCQIIFPFPQHFKVTVTCSMEFIDSQLIIRIPVNEFLYNLMTFLSSKEENKKQIYDETLM